MESGHISCYGKVDFSINSTKEIKKWVNQNSTFCNLQLTLIDVRIGIPVLFHDLVMSQKAWEYWMHCMLSYECFLYHQPVIQWVRTWKMQLMYDNLIDISFWTALLKACKLLYFTQRRWRRLRRRHLKSEFALPQTLSRLFHLVDSSNVANFFGVEF